MSIDELDKCIYPSVLVCNTDMSGRQVSDLISAAVNVFSKHGTAKLVQRTVTSTLTLLRSKITQFQYPNSTAETYKLLWIDPTNVEYFVHPGFYQDFRYGARIENGDWDIRKAADEHYQDFSTDRKRQLFAFDDRYDYFVALRRCLINNAEWEDTEYYDRALSRLENGTYAHGCENEAEFKRRNLEVEKLFRSIQKNGYLTQRELGNPNNNSPPESGETMVNICRNGRIVLDDGRHRLIMARFLGIEKIPVRVLVRHKKWQEKRQEIYEAERSGDLSPETRQYIDHPDMEDVASTLADV